MLWAWVAFHAYWPRIRGMDIDLSPYLEFKLWKLLALCVVAFFVGIYLGYVNPKK